MKKILILVLVLALSVSVLTACGGKPAEDNEDGGENGNGQELISLKIGVSPDPHAKIVGIIKEDLLEEGIEVEIIEFTDYVIPNTALEDGDLDANYFQHIPYLEEQIEERGIDLVSIGGVHVEPMAVYSDSLKNIDELPDGAEVSIPSDAVNGGRALLLLQANGLIKLKDDAGLSATEKDIVENPKNLKFTPLEAVLLPSTLDDVDIAVINGNYALEAGLNPLKDGLLVEDGDSPYLNIVAVKKGRENEEIFAKLMKALQSQKVKNFIIQEYDGAVVPGF